MQSTTKVEWGDCQWIGGPGQAFCRTEFAADRPVRKAILKVLADPHSYAIHHWQILPQPYPYDNWLVGGSFLKYRVFLNGEQVGAGPFRSLTDGVPVLHEFDVTAHVVEGENALAFFSRGEAKGFAAILRLEDEAGHVREIRTGEGWRQLDANAVYRTVCWEVPGIDQHAKGGSSPGEYPEHIDGAIYPQGWREAGFDDGEWKAAIPRGVANGVCEQVDIPPYVLTKCRPVEIRKLGEENYLLDFGRAVFGSIELSAPAGGGAIELRLAEELQPNGHARFQLRTENCYQEIWTFAPDSEPLQHLGTRMFRYAEILGWRGIFDESCITALALGAPFDQEASSFACSDGRLTEVWDLCKNTIAHTTADVFTDCLTRERLSYEADSYVTMLSHFAVGGSLETPRRTLSYLVKHPSWPCEWQQFFIPLFYEYLMQSGDYDFVDQHYQFLRETSYHPLMRRGLIEEFPRQCIVDWPESERDNYEFGRGNAVANALAHWDLELLSALADYLGRTREAASFRERAAELSAGFNQRLYDEFSGLYVDSEGSRHSSFHANLYALRFGLVPESRRSRCLDYIRQRGMVCSVFNAQFLLEALFMHGESENAVGLMLSDGPRSWREMIQQGAVTTTESWLTNAKRNMSWAHPWGSSPANIIVRHLFGLQATKPGWQEYAFSPTPGGLAHGSLHLSTPRGVFKAAFDRDGSGYKHSIQLEDGGESLRPSRKFEVAV